MVKFSARQRGFAVYSSKALHAAGLLARATGLPLGV
jgi:hypothetical protein